MNTYKTINDALHILLECETISKVDMRMVLDAHENEKAEWRNKMLKIAGIAYEAGRKFSWNEFEALKTDVIKGGFDVRM